MVKKAVKRRSPDEATIEMARDFGVQVLEMADLADTTQATERRSSRIQMRLAMEASANDASPRTQKITNVRKEEVVAPPSLDEVATAGEIEMSKVESSDAEPSSSVDERVEKETSSAELVEERRSSRIQIRLAMEASANDAGPRTKKITNARNGEVVAPLPLDEAASSYESVVEVSRKRARASTPHPSTRRIRDREREWERAKEREGEEDDDNNDDPIQKESEPSSSIGEKVKKDTSSAELVEFQWSDGELAPLKPTTPRKKKKEKKKRKMIDDEEKEEIEDVRKEEVVASLSLDEVATAGEKIDDEGVVEVASGEEVAAVEKMAGEGVVEATSSKDDATTPPSLDEVASAEERMADDGVVEVASSKEDATAAPTLSLEDGGVIEASVNDDAAAAAAAAAREMTAADDGAIEASVNDDDAAAAAARELTAADDGAIEAAAKEDAALDEMLMSDDDMTQAMMEGEEEPSLELSAEELAHIAAVERKMSEDSVVEVAHFAAVERKMSEDSVVEVFATNAEPKPTAAPPAKEVEQAAAKKSSPDDDMMETIMDGASDAHFGLSEEEMNVVARVVAAMSDEGVMEGALNKQPDEPAAVVPPTLVKKVVAKKRTSDDDTMEMARSFGAHVHDRTQLAAAITTPAATERRSSRIQMRLAMEASAAEEEERSYSRRARTITPPPLSYYPSNCEKMRELQSRRSHTTMAPMKRMPQHLQHLQQPAAAGGSKRSSRSGRSTSSIEILSQSSSIEIIATVAAAAPAAAAAQQWQQYTAVDRPAAAAAAARPAASRSADDVLSQTPRRTLSTTSLQPQMSSSMMMNDNAWLAGCGGGPMPSRDCSSSNRHYRRLDSLYGTGVHQHQKQVPAPLSRLYPAPLSAALMRTIGHPAWKRPDRKGADETRAERRLGHSHFLLPARMHRTETMIEKCLVALEDTMMPLPPLQPLLPAPCRALQAYAATADPLTDVLQSLPAVPLIPLPFKTHTVHTFPEAKYTTAFEGARLHVSMKSEDRKWWEVRTFPSFHGLATAGRAPQLLPTSARPRSCPTASSPAAAYSMAAGGFTRAAHTMKCTYVTSKQPIFSVTESRPMLRHGAARPPSSAYSMTPSSVAGPSTAYSTTPSSAAGPSTTYSTPYSTTTPSSASSVAGPIVTTTTTASSSGGGYAVEQWRSSRAAAAPTRSEQQSPRMAAPPPSPVYPQTTPTPPPPSPVPSPPTVSSGATVPSAYTVPAGGALASLLASSPKRRMLSAEGREESPEVEIVGHVVAKRARTWPHESHGGRAVPPEQQTVEQYLREQLRLQQQQGGGWMQLQQGLDEMQQQQGGWMPQLQPEQQEMQQGHEGVLLQQQQGWMPQLQPEQQEMRQLQQGHEGMLQQQQGGWMPQLQPEQQEMQLQQGHEGMLQQQQEGWMPQLQPEQQEMQQQLHPLEGWSAAAGRSESYCGSEPDHLFGRPEEIAVGEDGTTFTVL